MSDAVNLTGVTKEFTGFVAVRDLDLAIGDGEFFSLLGPSGCGKTTTLRMIAGFEFPTEGSVKIHGVEMALQPPNRRPVNTVFQSYALFPHMTVFDNVAFGLRMKDESKTDVAARAKRALEMVQLADRADALPNQLSGGMQQRVALARALVNEPEVLLLDEPLGALDLKLRQAMQYELKELQERVGITFLYVTHDQEEALTMSDRIGVMNEGTLLQVGTPDQIYERPASRFVADFIGDINLIEVVAVDGSTATLPSGQTVMVETGRAAGDKLTLAIRPERFELYDPDEPVPDGLNRLACKVARRTYRGDIYEYEVDLGGSHFTVLEENRPGVELYDLGEDAFVVWDSASSGVLSD